MNTATVYALEQLRRGTSDNLIGDGECWHVWGTSAVPSEGGRLQVSHLLLLWLVEMVV